MAMMAACATLPKKYIVEDGVIFEEGRSPHYGVGHEINLTGRMPLDFVQTVQNKSGADVIFERVVVGVGDRHGHLLFRRAFAINRRVAPGEAFTARRRLVYDWGGAEVFSVSMEARANDQPDRSGSCDAVRPDPARGFNDLPSAWLSEACSQIFQELEHTPLQRTHIPRAEPLVSPATKVRLPAIDDRESYAIYREMLDPRRGGHVDADAPRHVLIEETAANECFPIGTDLPAPWNEAAAAFNHLNLTPGRIVAARLGRLSQEWSVAPFANVTRLTSNRQEWTAFRRHYRTGPGYDRVSRVGFDSTRTHAVVYSEHICPGMCSGGRIVFLELDGGRWREADIVEAGLLPGCLWEV